MHRFKLILAVAALLVCFALVGHIEYTDHCLQGHVVGGC